MKAGCVARNWDGSGNLMKTTKHSNIVQGKDHGNRDARSERSLVVITRFEKHRMDVRNGEITCSGTLRGPAQSPLAKLSARLSVESMRSILMAVLATALAS